MGALNVPAPYQANPYKGRARRLALEQAEQQLAQAPRDEARRERQVQVQEEALEQRITEHIAKIGAGRALQESADVIGIYESTAGDLTAFNEGMNPFIDGLPDGEGKTKLQKMNADGFQQQEADSIYRSAQVMHKISNQTGVKSDYTIGDTRYSGETNKPLVKNPKGSGGKGDYTLGDTRYSGETNEPLAANPKEPSQSEKDKEIARYEAMGESHDKAVDLAYGNLDVTSSTDSMGNVTVTNKRTGKAYKVSARAARESGLDVPEKNIPITKSEEYTGPSWSKPAALIKPAANITNQNISESQGKIKEIDKALQAAALVNPKDVVDAAGVANIAQRGINNALQLISLNTLPRYFQEETDARLKVLFFNQAVRSAVVISSKGNVWEQQMVEKMLPKPDNILADPVGEGIAFSRTIHYLTNQREADVAFIEGRAPTQIPRRALGVKDDPIVVTSEKEANSHPSGTWVSMNGILGLVE